MGANGEINNQYVKSFYNFVSKGNLQSFPMDVSIQLLFRWDSSGA